VTVIASVGLATVFGSEGAVIGSLLGVCLVSLPGNILALARETSETTATAARRLLPWFWRFALLIAVSVSLEMYWIPSSYPAMALTALVALIVYAVVMAPIVLRPPLGVYVRERLPMFISRGLRLSINASSNA
jgi:hypothetical protein